MFLNFKNTLRSLCMMSSCTGVQTSTHHCSQEITVKKWVFGEKLTRPLVRKSEVRWPFSLRLSSGALASLKPWTSLLLWSVVTWRKHFLLPSNDEIMRKHRFIKGASRPPHCSPQRHTTLASGSNNHFLRLKTLSPLHPPPLTFGLRLLLL